MARNTILWDLYYYKRGQESYNSRGNRKENYNLNLQLGRSSRVTNKKNGYEDLKKGLERERDNLVWLMGLGWQEVLND